MKNINDVVRYIRGCLDGWNEHKVIITIPMWRHIVGILEKYCLRTGLPEKSGEYLCMNEYGGFQVLVYSEKHKAFNCHDEYDETPFKIDVVAWCELPEVPGGVKN